MEAEEPIVLAAGEGRRLTARGSEMTFKAIADTTGGRFSLMDRWLPPAGRRPPAHMHPECLEAFFVLEGEVEFTLGEREVRGGAGAFVLVPRGWPHTFGNPGPAPARLLVLHAPALDAYFEDLQQLWSGEPPDPQAELDLMRRHGLFPASKTIEPVDGSTPDA